ncbi:hypothetical protein PILCRDRAFT_12165 [Piloderma croceum F 1598]|uniref:Uncharacterized protein n=1 Tax=Piloderma croceum (strain F 1598) TaxID=765440 RepID=A0A0C3EXV7_PILCF|nr:hypothetical protein PILCRDRAFT_12165 [Piloderma croceum F 1598]
MNHSRTTVHDLTALSLHPTGSRARPHHTNSPQDARGNWIATDAGGWGAVPRRRAADGIESGGEDEPTEEDADAEDGKYNMRPKTDGGRNLKDRRARKRRKLVHDVDFIYGQNPHTALIECDDEFSTPSSDLLKQIHFFASRYYASQNILLDLSRMHRKEKKTKKMKDAAEGAEGDEDEESVSPGRDGRQEEEEEEEEESTDDEEMPSPPKKSARTKTTKRNMKLKKREKRQKELRRDMYKVFDGSALMVIGTSGFLPFPIISPPYQPN